MLEKTKPQVKILFLSRNAFLYCYIVYERQAFSHCSLSAHAQHFFNMNHANSPLSRGSHFVSKDLKSFIYARLAS